MGWGNLATATERISCSQHQKNLRHVWMPLLSLLTRWPVNIALNVGSSLHCGGYTPSEYSPQQPHMPLLARLVFHEAQPSLCDYRQLYFSSIQECDFKSAQIFEGFCANLRLRVLWSHGVGCYTNGSIKYYGRRWWWLMLFMKTWFEVRLDHSFKLLSSWT